MQKGCLQHSETIYRLGTCWCTFLSITHVACEAQVLRGNLGRWIYYTSLQSYMHVHAWTLTKYFGATFEVCFMRMSHANMVLHLWSMSTFQTILLSAICVQGPAQWWCVTCLDPCSALWQCRHVQRQFIRVDLIHIHLLNGLCFGNGLCCVVCFWKNVIDNPNKRYMTTTFH